MDIWNIYSQALEQYQAKNFDAALKILDEVKRIAPNYQKAYMLESYIWKDSDNPPKEADALLALVPLFDLSLIDDKANLERVLNRLQEISQFKEFLALTYLLPRLKISSPEDKKFALSMLVNFGVFADSVALIEEKVKAYHLAANLSEDKKEIDEFLTNAIFGANSLENFSAADFRELYAEYKKILSDVTPYPRKFYSHKKIRIGFLSADFYRHAVMKWGWVLLTELDKNFFEVYCYSSVQNPDNATEKLREKVDVWRDILNLSDEDAAKLIRDDEIDILFDLSGYTKGERLRVAAYRPASVQISGIGHINSTGLNCFDYFLSDVYCAGDAAAMKEYFTEKIIKLPHSHFCFKMFVIPEPPPEIAPKPPCMKNGFVTFGSFNHFRKITDSILIAWKKILDAVPNSRLLLKAKIFHTYDGKKFVVERLKNFGFDLSRIEMRGWTNTHPLDYNDMDIALDTFPYTGCVTTSEALYMGVPVVSLYGDRHVTRISYSILKNIELGDLATDSIDDYIKLAVALASDWELIAILRKNLRGMMKNSPLMDAKSYARDVEKVFIEILNEERRKI